MWQKIKYQRRQHSLSFFEFWGYRCYNGVGKFWEGNMDKKKRKRYFYIMCSIIGIILAINFFYVPDITGTYRCETFDYEENLVISEDMFDFGDYGFRYEQRGNIIVSFGEFGQDKIYYKVKGDKFYTYREDQKYYEGIEYTKISD